MKTKKALKKLEGRYVITFEWAGYSIPHYVVRWCGEDWLFSAVTLEEAIDKSLWHNEERITKL